MSKSLFDIFLGISSWFLTLLAKLTSWTFISPRENIHFSRKEKAGGIKYDLKVELTAHPDGCHVMSYFECVVLAVRETIQIILPFLIAFL
jgi:hypothetical protein